MLQLFPTHTIILLASRRLITNDHFRLQLQASPYVSIYYHGLTFSTNVLRVSLAYAELFTTFAYLFRKFDLEVYDTTEHDMDWHDCYTPATFGHLKVRVKSIGG